eukprot:TRINITY_DN20142_c0_g1_i1.p1 TRINITY_DN20142_c0_g1~~TRINITY_DN20142_c0_g1_i1.p1  ORF type:complete len:344 (+),score=130.09 TRINITY_DN20142_c0_g1_i1:49-1080(+)
MCKSTRVGATTFGFIGCGTINAAIVRGMCRSQKAAGVPAEFKERGGVWLSARSAGKVAALKEEFGGQVVFTVCEDVREIAQNVDVVVLGVRPEHFPEVLALLFSDAAICARVAAGELFFVNLAGTIGSEGVTATARGVAKGTGRASAELEAMFDSMAWLAKAMPLPPVQHRNGVTVLTEFVCKDCKDGAGVAAEARDAAEAKYGAVVALFKVLSGSADTAVVVPEAQLPIFVTITGTMGIFYQHCRVMQRWMQAKVAAADPGADAAAVEATTRDFLIGFFSTVMTDPAHGEEFQELMGAQTKGGLNEHGIEMLREDHKYEEALPQVLETLYGRIVGNKSKGAK